MGTPSPPRCELETLMVAVALKAAGERVSARRIAMRTGVAFATVLRRMVALTASGHLDKTGCGPRTRWDVLRVPEEMPALALPSRRTPKVRRCLGCREEFKSKGSHNRVCDGCKAGAAWRSGGNDLPVRFGE